MNRLMPDALLSTMWNLASSAIAGTLGMSRNSSKTTLVSSDCSDDEASSNRDESLLECPICWESFNIVENVPYVLWCGHTLCKNCVLGLQWAVVKLPAVPLQLPLFVSCPWCHLLSFRWVYKGNMKFPRKNFFVLWMVESMNGDRVMSHSDSTFNQLDWCSSTNLPSIRRRTPRVHPLEDSGNRRTGHLNIRLANYLNLASLNASLRKSLTFFVTLMAKLPFVIIFLLIVLYGIPASAVILVLYALVTIVVVLPAFLVLYFAYPILEWLVKEIRN